MRYRRFRTSSGQFLDALLTADGAAFSVPAESHRADHEAGYGVPLTVVEGDSDPWDGASTLLHAPPRPPRPPTAHELALAALNAATTLAEMKAALLKFYGG